MIVMYHRCHIWAFVTTKYKSPKKRPCRDFIITHSFRMDTLKQICSEMTFTWKYGISEKTGHVPIRCIKDRKLNENTRKEDSRPPFTQEGFADIMGVDNSFST